jgi:hypothetical protein
VAEVSIEGLDPSVSRPELTPAQWAQMTERQKYKYRKHGIVPQFLWKQISKRGRGHFVRGFNLEQEEARKKIYKKPTGPLWQEQRFIGKVGESPH